MPAARFFYLHGFASSPSSEKARQFRARLGDRGVGLIVPALDEGDFERLTIARMLGVVDRALDAGRGPAVIVGSSLGGYLAALTAARRSEVAGLFLMAPAFDFARRFAAHLGPEGVRRWRESGRLMVEHHTLGREVSLGPEIIEDAQRWPAWPDVRVPTTIVHGRRDASVPLESSIEFARARPNVELLVLDDEHGLTARFEEVWAAASRALSPWFEA